MFIVLLCHSVTEHNEFRFVLRKMSVNIEFPGNFTVLYYSPSYPEHTAQANFNAICIYYNDHLWYQQ